MSNLAEKELLVKEFDKKYLEINSVIEKAGTDFDYKDLPVEGGDEDEKLENYQKFLAEREVAHKNYEKAKAAWDEYLKNENNKVLVTEEGLNVPGQKTIEKFSLKSMVEGAKQKNSRGHREDMTFKFPDEMFSGMGMKALFATTGESPLNNANMVSQPYFPPDMQWIGMFDVVPLTAMSSLYITNVARGSGRAGIHARNAGAAAEGTGAADTEKRSAERIGIAQPVDEGMLLDNAQLLGAIRRLMNGEVVYEMAEQLMNGSGTNNNWKGLTNTVAATNLAADVPANGMLNWFRARITDMRINGVPVDWIACPSTVYELLDKDMIDNGFQVAGTQMNAEFITVLGVTVMPTVHLSDTGLKEVVFGAFRENAVIGLQQDVLIETGVDNFSNFETVVRASVVGACGFNQHSAGNASAFRVYKETSTNTFGGS